MAKIDKIVELQNLLKQDPKNIQARRQLAILLIDCGFSEEALKNLLYLSKNIKNDSDIYYNLGIVYEKLKNLSKAKEAYEKSIEIAPLNIDSIYNLGLVYTELTEYEDAIKCFEFVIKRDPNDSNSYFNIGLIYFKQKDYPSAINYFQRTTDINNQDIYAHFYIGNILKEFGDKIGAREEFEKVISISPDYSWAYYNLAVIDYEEGNVDNAIDNLNTTIELNPSDVEAYKILTKILCKIKAYDEAEYIINQALDNIENNGDLLYIAGKVAFLQGDFDSYKNYLTEAMKNYKTLSISQKTIRDELSLL